MNSKVKGVLQVLLVLVLIAAFAFVAARGIGGAHRGSAKNIRLGLDLEGGVSVTYQAYKTDSTGKRTGEQPTDKDMADTIYKMQKRVETLESTEAAVYQEGSDRVTIDIPGASDSEEVLKELGKAGALYFILYSDLKTEKGGTPNEGDKVVYDKSKVLLTGDMIGEATSGSRQQEGTGKTEYGVSIKFAGKGIKKFAKITGEHVGEQLAIVYDEKLVSAPNLKEEISGGECWISGSFTSESAEQLASTVRIGALPLELENIHAVCRDATVPDEAWKEKADIVLADLPCSGLGVFGKKPDLKYRVKEEDLKELAGLQRKILENAQAMVKKGGTLLYSTCTIDPMENEENVHWFLKKYPQFSLNSIREKLCPQLAESVEEEGCIQLLPGIHCSDGFFIARLKKNGEN